MLQINRQAFQLGDENISSLNLQHSETNSQLIIQPPTAIKITKNQTLSSKQSNKTPQSKALARQAKLDHTTSETKEQLTSIQTQENPNLEQRKTEFRNSTNLRQDKIKRGVQNFKKMGNSCSCNTAIVHALKMWRNYLMGRRFELRTEHCGLKYLFDQPTLNARKVRWLDFLCEFDFEIKHIKGKENKLVDALSRKVQEMHVASLSIFQSDLR